MYGFLLVALGGALGAAGRYGAGLLALRLGASGWPWATFAVNVVGSLLMGFAVAALALRGEPFPGARLLFATGVLGGFTTFSAFSLELAELLEQGHMLKAAGYAAASVGVSLAALFVGLFLARKLFA